MQKFTKLDEAKKFMPDPTLLKSYASFIIPLYITGHIKIEDNLLDEYLEMNKKSNRFSAYQHIITPKKQKTYLDWRYQLSTIDVLYTNNPSTNTKYSISHLHSKMTQLDDDANDQRLFPCCSGCRFHCVVDG